PAAVAPSAGAVIVATRSDRPCAWDEAAPTATKAHAIAISRAQGKDRVHRCAGVMIREWGIEGINSGRMQAKFRACRWHSAAGRHGHAPQRPYSGPGLTFGEFFEDFRHRGLQDRDTSRIEW